MDSSYVEHPEPDPVTREAVRAAMAATDPPKPRHPWLNRIVIVILSLCLLAGTIGAVVTVANTIALSQQNRDLQAEADCTQKLLQSFQSDSKARSVIAAADRSIIKNLVLNVSKSKTSQDVEKAFAEFNKESAANDKLRAKFPINPQITCKKVKDHGTASFGTPSTITVHSSLAPSKKNSSSSSGVTSTTPRGSVTPRPSSVTGPSQVPSAPPARAPRPSVPVVRATPPRVVPPTPAPPVVVPVPRQPIINPSPIVTPIITTVCKIVGLPIVCS